MTLYRIRSLRLSLTCVILLGSIPVEVTTNELAWYFSKGLPAMNRHTCGAHEKHLPLEALCSGDTTFVSGQREALLPSQPYTPTLTTHEVTTPGRSPHAAGRCVLIVNGMRGPPSA